MGRRKPTINGWCSIGNPFTAEIMAAQGFDSVTIDMQHGALDYSAVLPMFQAMRASGAVLMARVPENHGIMKALDAGAYGIICPMVLNAEDAARFVSAELALSATWPAQPARRGFFAACANRWRSQ